MSDSVSAIFSHLCFTLKARHTSDTNAKARCPVHGGKTVTSLSITNVGDRILIYCHKGCSYRDILHAVGLVPSDLFGPRPDKAILIVSRAFGGLDIWVEDMLLMVCDLLRLIDENIKWAHWSGDSEESMDLLAECYHSRREFTRYFKILNSSDTDAKVLLKRELAS